MRVAALYDVHGNLPALEAVLAEVERERPDAIVVGGDVAAGPFPGETLDRLAALDGVRFVRGNADRELVELFDGVSTLRAEHGDDVWVRRGEWEAERLTRAHRDLLASFEEPLALGGTLFCHGSPRSDEEVITTLTPDALLGELLAGVEQRLVVCGHTHVQFDRRHGATRVVNAGSVGMPLEAGPGAYWLLLGREVELRRTAYDLDAAAERIRASGYPEPDELVARLTAEDAARPAEAAAMFERSVGREPANGP